MNARLAVLPLALALGACQSSPRVATREASQENQLFVGEWESARGGRMTVSDRLGPGYRVEIDPVDREPETLDARLTDIAGRQFVEVSVNHPGGDEVPVYHYGLITITETTLTHQALAPSWVERYGAGEGKGDVVVGVTEEGWSFVGCRDPEAVRAMLAAAAEDAGAFEPVETLTRVQ